jgi:methylated-DNA-[protein]-cysteine S-methyltransferase
MVTPFQQKVYNALGRIPRGKVTTYKLLAEYLDCNSSQAIGQALRRNPYAPEVPCHRVIKSDLTIGGYSGEIDGRKLQRKLDLLRQEGVLFQDGKLTDPQRVIKIRAK